MNQIVSGGQTGVDRAALDWAIASHVAHGGWCPKGRRAEDGLLDPRYQLRETESGGYRQRTKRNVIDSDGTLIVNIGELSGGTLATVRFAEQYRKPVLVLQLDRPEMLAPAKLKCMVWLRDNAISVLNVAGPKESKRPGIYVLTRALLEITVDV